MGQGGHMHKFTFIFALLLAGPLMASDWMPITSGDLRAGALLTSDAQVPASRHAETRPVSFARHLRDRKSTRLNSSHVAISYAVFCLKKKTNRRAITLRCTLIARNTTTTRRP